MKKLKINFLLAVLFSASVIFTSCGNKQESKSESTEQSSEKSGPEYTSAYVCPMHCEGSGSDTTGNCPVCGMDYVKNEDYAGDENNHEDHNH